MMINRKESAQLILLFRSTEPGNFSSLSVFAHDVTLVNGLFFLSCINGSIPVSTLLSDVGVFLGTLD